MLTRKSARIGLIALASVASTCWSARAADSSNSPTVEQMLTRYRPTQKDVEYETPAASEMSKCRKAVERTGNMFGYVIYGPSGQVLRRFVDTDGDNRVDQWRYYNHGLEVYRDIDTNKNTKPDQYRWLNNGGSRWALDPNEDGKIDSWKSLSMEEAIRQAVIALIKNDEELLRTVLVTKDELQGIGVGDSYAAKIMAALSDVPGKISEIHAKTKVVTPQTAFMRTDNATPCAIPAEEGKLKEDLIVYENAMAIVETQGKPGLIEVGELVRIGDVWKLTQVPQPIEGNATQVVAGGVLMQPTLSSSVANVGDMPAPSPEVQRLLTDLQKLDQSAPPPTAGAKKQLGQYNSRRADLLAQLVSASSADGERAQWTRQMIDSIASGVQMGAFPDGLARLEKIESDFQQSSPSSPILPYVTYRRILSESYTRHQASEDAKQQEKIQTWWRAELEKFIKQYPKADDTPEALLQLAIANEFIAKGPEAKRWYSELAEKHPETKAGRRAAGALRRLDLKGKPFDFAGPTLEGQSINARDYRGKVLLVVYWSTWCTTCTEDLPLLKSLYEQNHGKGFEIVGVNLDVTAAPVGPFLKQQKIEWPQIFQPGGIESEPAAAFGVIVPPVMILVDRQGKVVTVTSGIEEVKNAIPDLIAAK